MTRKRNTENEMVVSGGTAPARRKTAARPRAKHSVAPPEASSISAAEQEIGSPVAVTTFEPSRGQIAELAYLYWEARGCAGGSPEEDWLRAELELRGRVSVAASA